MTSFMLHVRSKHSSSGKNLVWEKTLSSTDLQTLQTSEPVRTPHCQETSGNPTHHTTPKPKQTKNPTHQPKKKTPAKENQQKTQHEPLAERRANNWSSCGRLEKLRPWKALQQTLEESPYTNLHAGPSRRSERAWCCSRLGEAPEHGPRILTLQGDAQCLEELINHQTRGLSCLGSYE